MSPDDASPAADTGIRVSARPFTPTEARRYRRQPIPPLLRNLPGTFARYVVFVLILWMALAALGSLVFTVLDRTVFHGPIPALPRPAFLALAALVWAPILVLPGIVALRSHRARMREDRARDRDATGGAVECLHLPDPRVAIVALDGPVPALLFALDARESLLVVGEAPWEPSAATTDAGVDRAGDACPALRGITIEHLPHSGRLLRILADDEACDTLVVAETPEIRAAIADWRRLQAPYTRRLPKPLDAFHPVMLRDV